VWLDGFLVVVLMNMCVALYFFLVLWVLGLVGCGYLVSFVYLMGECKSVSWCGVNVSRRGMCLVW
jgi:hypothetical protein